MVLGHHKYRKNKYRRRRYHTAQITIDTIAVICTVRRYVRLRVLYVLYMLPMFDVCYIRLGDMWQDVHRI